MPSEWISGRSAATSCLRTTVSRKAEGVGKASKKAEMQRKRIEEAVGKKVEAKKDAKSDKDKADKGGDPSEFKKISPQKEREKLDALVQEERDLSLLGTQLPL